jgi:hypothetical protein
MLNTFLLLSQIEMHCIEISHNVVVTARELYINGVAYMTQKHGYLMWRRINNVAAKTVVLLRSDSFNVFRKMFFV